MTVKEFILQGRRELDKASLQCADPLLHMKQIAQFGLGWDTTELYLRWDEPLLPEQLEGLNDLLSRRLLGEPFQYLVGYEWFWDSKFEVGPGVLIPRRETELLVEAYLKEAPSNPQKVAELGAGTGNIGLTLLQNRSQDTWHAFELNPDSFQYAQRNQQKLLPDTKQYFLYQGDFFEEAGKQAPFHWLIANPPYVDTKDWNTLAREVQHEPRLALDGGEEGLEILRRLIQAGTQWLAPGGSLLFEIGAEQKAAVERLLSEHGYHEIKVMEDYAHLPRVAYAQIGEKTL